MKRSVIFDTKKDFSPSTQETKRMLDFLQSALEMGLAYNTIKVQVSALSAFIGHKWAEEPLIRQFLRMTMKI